MIFAQMVDDPSAYVDTLRGDPKLRRKAETVLKTRLKLWEEAKALAEKTKGTGLPGPEPGPAPTLDEINCPVFARAVDRVMRLQIYLGCHRQGPVVTVVGWTEP